MGGDVSRRAVRISGPDGYALGFAFAIQHSLFGIDVDAGAFGDIGRVPGDIGANPFQQGLGHFGVEFKSLASGVRHRADGLFHDQRRFRERQIDPTTRQFAADAVVISIGVVAEQREAKTIFFRWQHRDSFPSYNRTS